MTKRYVARIDACRFDRVDLLDHAAHLNTAA